jgi:hypothetical protein
LDVEAGEQPPGRLLSSWDFYFLLFNLLLHLLQQAPAQPTQGRHRSARRSLNPHLCAGDISATRVRLYLTRRSSLHLFTARVQLGAILPFFSFAPQPLRKGRDAPPCSRVNGTPDATSKRHSPHTNYPFPASPPFFAGKLDAADELIYCLTLAPNCSPTLSGMAPRSSLMLQQQLKGQPLNPCETAP